jgi:histone H3/H4
MADTTIHVPKASVKRIMKINDDVSLLSAEAIIATAKATEFFIEQLTRDCLKESSSKDRKIVRVDDLLKAMENNQLKYEFLSEAFGQRK